MCGKYCVDAMQLRYDSLKSHYVSRFTERLPHKGLASAVWNDNCIYRRSSNARPRRHIEARPRVRSMTTTLFAGGSVVYVQQMLCH